MPALPQFLPWGRSPQTQPANSGSRDNPFSVIRNQKSPELGDRINKLLSGFDELSTSTATANQNYLNRFNAATPQIDRFNTQDMGYLSDRAVSLPGLLADLRARRRTAVEGAAGRALGDLRKTLSLNQMGSGGGGRGAGTSSYLARLGLKNASAIRTQQALDDAAQERADMEYADTIRRAIIGQRQSLADSATGRELAYTRGLTDRQDQLAAQLAKLLQLDQANNFIGLGADA